MQNRSAYWTAYRNVSMAIESWHAGSDNCDTLTQYLGKLFRSPMRTSIGMTAARNAVVAYIAHINECGSVPHSCFEVAEGETCPWQPKGQQVK